MRWPRLLFEVSDSNRNLSIKSPLLLRLGTGADIGPG